MDTHATEITDANVPARWAWFYQRLRFLRDRLAEARGAHIAVVSESVDSSALEFGDSGMAEFDRDMAMGLLKREEDALYEIDAAIRRIVTSSYGICEDTGNPIPEARLRAIPWTRYTLEAQERIEQEDATAS